MLLGPVEELTSVPRPVVAMAKDFPPGPLVPFHKHTRSELLYASEGVMTVRTNNDIWVVPPCRAVWIPAFTPHNIFVSGRLSLRTVYIDPAYFSYPGEGCFLVAVSPLLKELILHTIRMPRLYPLKGPEERLIRVLIDQIRDMNLTPLKLPIPKDARVNEIYRKLLMNPGDNRSLEDWGKVVGATKRTLARHFRSETGMTFTQFRQQVRILMALRRLGMKESVTTIAMELGYESSSAFITMFKKALGKTPGQYFREG